MSYVRDGFNLKHPLKNPSYKIKFNYNNGKPCSETLFIDSKRIKSKSPIEVKYNNKPY